MIVYRPIGSDLFQRILGAGQGSRYFSSSRALRTLLSLGSRNRGLPSELKPNFSVIDVRKQSGNGIFRRHLTAGTSPQKPPYPWFRVILVSDVYELDAFPRLKTLIDLHKRDGPENNTLVCCAGDFLSPSLLSSLDKGAGMVDCLNAIGVTHVCFGNHETDFGPAVIKDRIEQSEFRWINTNMRELDDIVGVKTFEHEIIPVSDGTTTKNVGLLGLLSDNPGLYKPDAFGGAQIEPVHSATERLLRSDLSQQVDIWIPMTHQGIVEDRIFAKKFTGDVFPVILGSHDHDVYNETVADSRIIQTGMDAEVAAIIDLKWNTKYHSDTNDSRQPEVNVQMLNPTDFEPDLWVEKRVKGHQKIITHLQGAPLFQIQEYIDWENTYCKRLNQPPSTSFSTQNNRFGNETGTKAICTLLRVGMRAHCALIHAGAVRRNKAYDNSHIFTWSDLKAEVLFPTHMTAINLPGKVLEETIAHSRRFCRQTPPVGKGGYLHTCNHIDFDDKAQSIRSINGLDFHPEKLYLTAVPSCFFGGIDNHKPLLQWAAGQKVKIDAETGIPAKIILVQVLSAVVWLELGSFEDIDLNQDGVLSRDEVKARIQQVFGIDVADLVLDSVFSVCDLNADGTISPVEMMIVECVAMDMMSHDTEGLKAMKDIASRVLGQDPSIEEVKNLIQNVRGSVYIADDGTIRGEEVVRALAEFEVANDLLT